MRQRFNPYRDSVTQKLWEQSLLAMASPRFYID
jgi:hypothetical protein